MVLEQLDVKTTFLYGNLKKIVYLQQLKGIVEERGNMCRLKKSLYDLK